MNIVKVFLRRMLELLVESDIVIDEITIWVTRTDSHSKNAKFRLVPMAGELFDTLNEVTMEQ